MPASEPRYIFQKWQDAGLGKRTLHTHPAQTAWAVHSLTCRSRSESRKSTSVGFKGIGAVESLTGFFCLGCVTSIRAQVFTQHLGLGASTACFAAQIGSGFVTGALLVGSCCFYFVWSIFVWPSPLCYFLALQHGPGSPGMSLPCPTTSRLSRGH